MLEEAVRVLKKGGSLLVVDWRDSFGNMGPPADMVFTEDATRALLQDIGVSTPVSIDVGSYHYGIIATV